MTNGLIRLSLSVLQELQKTIQSQWPPTQLEKSSPVSHHHNHEIVEFMIIDYIIFLAPICTKMIND